MEIDEKFETKLKLNLRNANIKIVDSFKYADICQKKYDFIVFDNPQMCFGVEDEYCEHFDALDKIYKLGKKKQL